MRKLEIKTQPNLSPFILFDLTWTAIRYRLFRSVVTVLVVTVAIAFVVSLLIAAINTRAVRSAAEEEFDGRKVVARWASQISHLVDRETVLRELVEATHIDLRRQEIVEFTNLTVEQERLFNTAITALTLLDFLRKLPYRERRELAGSVVEIGILDHLAEPDNLRRFLHVQENYPRARFEMSQESVRALSREWPELSRHLDILVGQQHAAIRALGRLSSGRNPIAVLASGDEHLREMLQSAGYIFKEVDYKKVVRLAQTESLTVQFEMSFNREEMKQILARRMKVFSHQLGTELVWKFLHEKRQANWYRHAYRPSEGEQMNWTAEDLFDVAGQRVRDWELQKILHDTREAEDDEGFYGLSARTSILMIVALLLCSVGITNALLMAVTERYREIATLKCLGALDSSILGIFVLEATLIGTVGGCAGFMVGWIASTIEAGLRFGAFFWLHIQWWDMLGVFGLSLAGGALLAGIAAVYPSWKAARLAPLEAMRIR